MNSLNESNNLIEHVSVDQISAQLLGKDHYARGYLMNRNRLGIPLRERLEKHLKAVKKEKVLAIDLDGIQEMTTSVAEEIGPKLFERFLAHRSKDKEIYLIYCNVSEEIANGFEGVFKSWQSRLDPSSKLTVVVFGECKDGRFAEHRFLGEEIPDALQEILDLVYNLGQMSSSDLEVHGIKAASRKLNELFKQYPWLLRKLQKSLDTGPRAWAYFYSPIVSTLDDQEGS
jgi:hypothetical protein